MSASTYPRARATVTGPTATFTAPDGRTESVAAAPDEDIRHLVVQRAASEARRTGFPLELVTSGDRGDFRLLVSAGGEIAAVPNLDDPPPTQITAQQGEEVKENAQEPAPSRIDPAPEHAARPSFIDSALDAHARQSGWRGFLTALGLRVGRSAAEVRRADYVREVSQHWAGCRTIAIANGKGGVGKTMTTAMISAVFAREGGGNVLAWDNNDTRGTLGWRTEQGTYDTTVRDLLPAAIELLSASASVSDISRFVHHQSADRYDVLRSNPELLAAHQRILQAEFDTLMQVAARYYRLVVFDSGNDESADRWLRMIDSSYQLVIPTLASPESAESAALLLDALRERDARSRWLAENAVVVVTQSEPADRREVARIVAGFEGQVRVVERIPFDPALKSGPLRFDALRKPTQDAWLSVAASAARGLG